MHTPLGYVCQGYPLSIEHAFFVIVIAGEELVKPGPPSTVAGYISGSL
jgi:hypothetical protein